MQVEVFSDVVCPWCYIGKRRLEEALGNFAHADDVTITYRSFQLDPTTPVDVPGPSAQRLADKYGVSLAEAEAMGDRVTAVAADAGLEFHTDISQPTNTFDAHRLLHFAAEHGKQAELKERLLAAYFCRGEHVGHVDSLVAIAAEVGLDPAEARAVLNSDRYADEVREDFSLARAFGVNSVPFFVIDRKYGIAGAQEAATLEQALENAWMESHPLTMVGAQQSGTAPADAGRADTDAAGSCEDGVCRV
ncbi:MAG: DsbA family oxidoreductase [Nakamurella sp.]